MEGGGAVADVAINTVWYSNVTHLMRLRRRIGEKSEVLLES